MRINLIELFEESVRQYPGKVAVIDKERMVTFSQLHTLSLQLAAKVVDLGIPQNRPVAVFLDKSVESVYSNLGILYARDF